MGAAAAALIAQWPVKVPIHRGVSSCFMAAWLNRCVIYPLSSLAVCTSTAVFAPYLSLSKVSYSKSIIQRKHRPRI